jgi:hypothetical protein
LLPEGEIFQEKITTRTKEYDNRNGQEPHQTQHQSSIPRKHGSLDTGSFASFNNRSLFWRATGLVEGVSLESAYVYRGQQATR